MPRTFSVVASRDLTSNIAFFGDAPPSQDVLTKSVGAVGFIVCRGNVEESLEEIFREIDQGEVFNTDPESFLPRAYEFFVAGWNAAAGHMLPSAQRMTVEELRKFIMDNPAHRAPQVLSGFLKQVGFYFWTESSRLTKKKLEFLLAGIFQTAFNACVQEHVRERGS